MATTALPQVVLAGFESVGKSALFRGLTGYATGDEANFRGSTVVCRKCRVADCDCEVVDTPGIRLSDDVETTQTALSTLRASDVVLMVARGTHAVSEVEALLSELDLKQKKSALVITFKDRASAQIESLAQVYRERLGIPVVVVNARELDEAGRARVLGAIESASEVKLGLDNLAGIVRAEVQPQQTWFEQALLGPVLSLAVMALMFALPVYLAYVFASWAQPLVDRVAIAPLKVAAESWPKLAQVILTGGYGAISLGLYSFLWAFPVVLGLGVAVALTEESGLKDRITAALDPWLRYLGLSGRDLIPVLTGFGCNVVAVFQSRSCSRCTRSACVSMIGFGSACSYQIGASLSILGGAGHPELFFPYLAALFVVGALHTRFWHGGLSQAASLPMQERAFLQKPSMRAVGWRVRAVLGQFLRQAMPAFLLICLAAALLEHLGVLAWMATQSAPGLGILKLPGDVAPAILFSVLRKDGLLALNSSDAGLITHLGAGHIFLTVWLASTLTPCLVTLWTVGRELGWRHALLVAGRQSTTAFASSLGISLFL